MDTSPTPVDVLLADGRVAVVRRTRPTDHDALVALHGAVSDESLRLRFFTINRDAGRAYAERLVHIDDRSAEGPLALVVELEGRVVAVGSAEPAGVHRAEVAFLVADDAHGLGLGTLLLEHLAAAARDRGVRHFTAEVLTDNSAMLRVSRDAGFGITSVTEDGVTSLELDTAGTPSALAAADHRECVSEARSLAPLLQPRSVAIVGVRRRGNGIGRAVLEAVRRGGYDGRLVVIHPSAAELDGVPAVPDFASAGPVDLAVVAVPPEHLLEVARDAGAAGVRAMVVLTAGLAESGDGGREVEREQVRIARQHSMRLVGPNCLGVMCTLADVRLNATFAPELPPPGSVAVASQSGGVGIALLDAARESGLGLGWFVSLGNKADVSGNDLLAAWLEDDRVTAAALYLESFGNPRKFARIARRFSERKPLLAVVGGTSDGGRRAGASHTASAAAPAVGVEALFRHAGVIACHSVEELADAARLLTEQPLPAGPRLGIVGNAGGLGVLAADAAARHGLVVPELDDATRTRIERLTGAASAANPVDLGAGAGPYGFETAVAEALAADDVDAVLVVVAVTSVTLPDQLVHGLGEARARAPGKPLLIVVLGAPDGSVELPAATTRFRSVDAAVRALGHAVAYGAWRGAPVGIPLPEVPGRGQGARRLVQGALDGTRAGGAPDGWLPLDGQRELLRDYGIEALDGHLTQGVDDALAAARRIGFPVVAKVADPTVVHKTDRGLVALGLTSEEAVRQAVESFQVAMRRLDVPVLVQPEIGGGVEIALGIVADPAFGPLVMVAAGGVATDVWDDRVFLVPPVTDVDAARAVRSLRVWPLLAGFRGSPPLDVAALEATVLALGRLAVEVPEVVEADLNPVILTPRGLHVVDVRIRVAPADARIDDGVPRRLRAPR